VTGLVGALTGQSTPTPSPSDGAPPPSSTPISPWWWLLLVAIVAGLVAGAVLLWRRRGRRKTWSDELARVTTELRWADDQLIPGMLTAPTAAEFARAWNDGRPRLVAADQQLYGLAQRAPEETGAATVAELRSAIAGLTAAVDAEAGLSSADPEELRAARAGVERARSAFAAALDAAEGTPRPVTPEASPAD
jgi:hypothetical protein